MNGTACLSVSLRSEPHRYRRMLKGRVSKNHDTFLATARQRTIKMLEHELHDECVEKLNGWYVKKGGWKFVEKEGRLYVKLSLPVKSALAV